MRLSSDTSVLANCFGDESAIRILKKAGFDAFDFSACGDRVESEILTENYLEHAYKLKRAMDEEGIVCNQSHAPFNFTYEDALDESGELYTKLIRSMHIASILGAKNIIVHTIRIRVPEEKFIEYNKAFYRGIIPYCQRFNICASVENLFYRADYDRTQIFPTFKSAEEHREFVKSFNSPWINACVDTGHCALTGFDAAEWIRTMGKGIVAAVHIHDNDSVIKDFHRLPYMGSINWDDVCAALKEIEYEGDFTYEALGFFEQLDPRLLESAYSFSAELGRVLMEKIR